MMLKILDFMDTVRACITLLSFSCKKNCYTPSGSNNELRIRGRTHTKGVVFWVVAPCGLLSEDLHIHNGGRILLRLEMNMLWMWLC
jgi:hypothetical protein